ncbi:MAG: hypothetical protein V4733_03350 [Verrucomicrobiota bacterium]
MCLISEKQAEMIERAARSEADQAVGFASAGTPPEIENIMESVYWETDNRTPPRGSEDISSDARD